MVNARRFRTVMGHFATGVTVVTGRSDDGEPYGFTANAVTAVSLDPVLVLVCLDREAESHDRVLASESFAMNILASDGEWLARRFAEGDREVRFDGVEHREEVTGSPILEDALAWLDCGVRETHAGGDHTIVVGEVHACDSRPGSPLIFYRGRFRGHAP